MEIKSKNRYFDNGRLVAGGENILACTHEHSSPSLGPPYIVMHHAMRQFFEVCVPIHVMYHANEACMKRIKLVWYFEGGASCKDRCMRLCMKCVVTFHVKHQFLAVIVCCQGCKIMDQANKWMKIQVQIHENLYL